MILVLAVALAALSVPLLGGDLGRIAGLRPTRPVLVAVALGLQILIISVLPTILPAWLAQALHLASYAAVALFVWANRRIPWLWLVGLGGLANLVAIGANAGVMPASRAALAAAGRLRASPGFTNSAYRAGAHLRFLGDIFSIPRHWPLANVFSPGDVLLVVGATLLLHAVGRSRPARWSPPGRWGAGRRPGRRPAPTAQSVRARIRAMAPAGMATQPGR